MPNSSTKHANNQNIIDKSPKTAIMGFGNPCRSDDGVGVYVVNELKSKILDKKNISIFDMGTSAFEVLFNLKGHSRIIVVDAVTNTGEAPGTLYKLPASEIETAIVDDPLVFLHSLKWNQALNYAKNIMADDYPEDITVYLVAVDNTRLDVVLGNEVKAAGDKLVSIILEDILHESVQDK